MSERYHLHHGVELIIEQEIIDLLRDHGVPDLAIEKLDTTISPRIALRYHASAPFSKKKELEVESEGARGVEIDGEDGRHGIR